MPPDQPEQLAIPAVEKAPVLEMRNFSAGIQTNVSSGLVGSSQLRYVVNMNHDPDHTELGTLKSRRGFENRFGYIDADVSAVDPDDYIVGIFANSIQQLIVAIQRRSAGGVYTQIYNDNTDVWSDIGGSPVNWSTGSRLRFERTFDYTYGVSVNTGSLNYWDQNISNNWTGVPGAPTSKDIELFQGRLYVVSSSDSIIYSDLINSGVVPTFPSINNISIYPRGTDQSIIALKKSGGLLLFFKTNSIYTYDGNQTQSEPLYEVGVINKEVIQTIEQQTFFVWAREKDAAVYMYSGSHPVEISQPVSEFLQYDNLINNENIAELFGSWSDGESYFLSINDVIIDNTTYTNIILQYSLKNQSWTTHSIVRPSGTNNFFNVGCLYSDSTANSTLPIMTETSKTTSLKKYLVIGGTALGLTTNDNVGIAPVVWDYNDSGGDNVGESTNNPIEILIQTHELEHGSRSRLKTVNKFNVFASGNYGFVEVSMRVDGGEWESLGGLTGKTTTFEPGEQGYYFEYKITGSNTGDQFIFEGWDFFDVTIEACQP